jgi:outer membrane immunogenic protein
MKRILLASVAALGLAGTASAADLAVRAPAPLPVPLFSWTGCYLGINGGWIGGRDEYSHHSFFGETDEAGVVITPPTVFDPVSYSSDQSGGTFGGQFGCQYQWGAVVLGGEWDANWSGLKEDNYIRYFSPFWSNFYGVDYPGYSQQWSHKQVDWFSTARVRLGWAAWDRFLIYATGGVALAAYDAYTHYNDNPNFFDDPNNRYFGAYRENRIGWTVGGGFEWAFAANWTAKAEFLYLDFGSFDYISPSSFDAPPLIFDRRFTSIDAKEYVARVGINYLFHLGPAVAPVYARY